jgi:hypothetical protein
LGGISGSIPEALATFEVFRGRKDENAAIFAVLEPTIQAMAATI